MRIKFRKSSKVLNVKIKSKVCRKQDSLLESETKQTQELMARFFFAVVLLSFVTFFVPFGSSQTIHTPTSGQWSSVAIWGAQGKPQAQDTVIINSGVKV